MDKKVCKAAVEPMTIYVWDMDETLILLKSLLDGKYAGVFNGMKDARKGVEIGKQWEKHILNICDECFFYKEVSLPKLLPPLFVMFYRPFYLSRWTFKQDRTFYFPFIMFISVCYSN